MIHPLLIALSLVSAQAAEPGEGQLETFSGITQATCAPEEIRDEAEVGRVSIRRLYRDVEAVLETRSAPPMQCRTVEIAARYFHQGGDRYSGSLARTDNTRRRVWVEHKEGVDLSQFDGQAVIATGRFYWLCAFAIGPQMLGPCHHAGVQGLVLEDATLRLADTPGGSAP